MSYLIFIFFLLSEGWVLAQDSIVPTLPSEAVPTQGAQPTKEEPELPKKKKKKNNKRNSSTPDTLSLAAQARMRSSQGYALLYSPLSDLFLKLGFVGTYQISEDWLSYFQVLLGRGDLLKKTDDQDLQLVRFKSATGMSVQAVLGSRYVFWNSFTLSAGLGYRQVVANYKLAVESTSRLSEASGTTVAKSLVFQSSLGNHWTFANGWTLGIDWLGLALPFAKGFTYKVLTGEISNDSGEDVSAAVENFSKKLSGTQTMTLGLIHLGLRF